MIRDGRGASPWVHGFNNPVREGDSARVFLEDTLKSGHGLSDPELAEALCTDSAEIFDEIAQMGLSFNRTLSGEYQAIRPLGASFPRVVSIGNETGTAVIDRLSAELGDRITEFPNAEHLNELMIVGPLTVRSACSHHLCPVIGKIWIGVMPNEHTNVIGLSKYARLAEWVMGRPQIQEEAVVQLADLIQQKTQPDGLAIVMEASHYCMSWRGVKDMDSKMINSVMRGSFLKDPNLRREFLSLIPKRG